MKPGSITVGRVLLAMLTVATMFTLVSWDRHHAPNGFQQHQNFNDTTPKNKQVTKEKKVRDLDDVLDEWDATDFQKEMEKAQLDMQKAMKEFDTQKWKTEMDKAMKEIDFEKMQKDWKESLSKMDIDMGKMKKELEESMKEFDTEKVKAEVDKAMKEVDFEKLQKEWKDEMAKVDWDKWKENMDEFKKVDMAKMEKELAKTKEQMAKIGPQLEKEMQKARVEMEKAKTQMKEFKGFVDGLEKDGLIKKSAGYSLQHKNGELLINGKKASNATYQKYRSFLEKHPTFNIKKSDDDFNIDVD
jgi:excinuclease UvrABC ATPase subunit